tara:strand:+ start:1095 stop:1253 length:159 start_codon:yes stop_codon:yes gene_type:complete
MKKKPTLCPTCKNYHPPHDDGFEYLDCMLFIKKRDNEKKTSYTDNNGRSFFI